MAISTVQNLFKDYGMPAEIDRIDHYNGWWSLQDEQGHAYRHACMRAGKGQMLAESAGREEVEIILRRSELTLW